MRFVTIEAGGDGRAVISTRSTYSKQLAYGPADWSAAIGSSGGEHSLTTCQVCWQRSLLTKWREASGVTDSWRSKDAALVDAISSGFDSVRGFSNVNQHVAERLRQELEDFQIKDFDVLVERQAARFIRIARTCSLTRIQALQREVRRHGALALAQAKMPHTHPLQAKACMIRHFACLHAADIMFSRMRDAVKGRRNL